MYDPPHPGRSLRESMKAMEWTATKMAAKARCSRKTLSRVLNESAGISPALALGLERAGWSNARFWMRVQAGYDLAQEELRRDRAARTTVALEDLGHPGPWFRESLERLGWTVTETAARLGVPRRTLSRFLKSQTRLSPTMALAFERIGWCEARMTLRLQAHYEVAQERLRRERTQAKHVAA